MKPGRYIFLAPSSGLEAVLYIDSLSLGPAVGGVRTRAYARLDDAIDEAAKLARAMTEKCALAGLKAGGCKVVVREGPGLDRSRAYAQLGKFLSDFGDDVHVGADLGTSQDEIHKIAKHFAHVHGADDGHVSAAGNAVLGCIEAWARVRKKPLAGMKAAIQGVGIMGEAVAKALAGAGMELFITDLSSERGCEIAQRFGATFVDPEELFGLEVDVLVPCALGGVIDEEVAKSTGAWAICGAANNVIATTDAERILFSRDVLVVPDVISSAGAVTHGIATELMGMADTSKLVERLGLVAEDVLRESISTQRIPSLVASSRARTFISAARRR